MLSVKLTIKELGQKVAQEIERRTPSINVDIKEVIKNNSLILHGIVVRDTTKESNVSPTIYLDNFYEGYLNDEITVEEIADKIIEQYNECRIEIPFSIELITKFENVKNKLRIKLINTIRNKEFLMGVPHKEFLDLSTVYQIVVFNDGEELGTISVTNDLIGMYGITVDKLHEYALENMKTMEPVYIRGITDTIAELTGEDSEVMKDMLDDEIDENMLIITNEGGNFGASQILQHETLIRIADIFKQDFYIVPSSIHEMMAVKHRENDVEGLKKIVKEVNDDVVCTEYILSYNVYHYNITTGELSIA